jgi:hypothetical protein
MPHIVHRARPRKRSKEFSGTRFAWLDQVLADSKLPSSSFKVAFYLSQQFNESRDGMAWPGLKTMANAVGLSKGGTFKAVQCLHARGHLEVEWGSPGRGHSNRYWWIIKGHSSDLSADIKGHFSSVKGQPADLNPSIALVQGYRRRRQQQGARATPAPEEWLELCEIWQRPWPDDPKAGQRAFEAACQETTPEVIIEAAQAWVAAADAPRFLQPLAKWLDGRGWEKEPPKRKARGRNGGKADLAALAFAYGDYQPHEQVEEVETPDNSIIELEAVTLREWHTPTVVELFGEEAARWRDVP